MSCDPIWEEVLFLRGCAASIAVFYEPGTLGETGYEGPATTPVSERRAWERGYATGVEVLKQELWRTEAQEDEWNCYEDVLIKTYNKASLKNILPTVRSLVSYTIPVRYVEPVTEMALFNGFMAGVTRRFWFDAARRFKTGFELSDPNAVQSSLWQMGYEGGYMSEVVSYRFTVERLKKSFPKYLLQQRQWDASQVEYIEGVRARGEELKQWLKTRREKRNEQAEKV